MTDSALQDLIPHNHCFGCGPSNALGLLVKSYWSGDGPSVARFEPQAHHCAGPKHFVNGGILAAIIDCHCVCTATAAAYRDAGRAVGEAPFLHFATAKLELRYQRPTPLPGLLELSATVKRAMERTYVVSCTVVVGDKVCVEADVEAIRVPESWMAAPREAQ